jgi:hemolysin III
MTSSIGRPHPWPFPVAGAPLVPGDTGAASIGNLSGRRAEREGRLTVTATDSTAEPPAAEAFYDARRDVYYTKPALRGWLHLLWFEVSLVFGTLLLARAHGATRIAASAIYAASVCGMFGISALYHCGSWSAAWRQRLQRLDHAMIFFLIAGTATPAFLLAVRGALGLVCLIVMWALTVTAAAVRMARMSTPELAAGAMFAGLGWLAGLALPWVWAHAGVASAVLILAGGLLYTAGALSYHRRWPDPIPSVFGYHEVFHGFVCAAATCQFVAIAVFIT